MQTYIQYIIIDSRVNGIGNMHQGHFARVRVNTGSESSSARALAGNTRPMATGLPAVNDVEPFSPGTG